MKRHCRVFEIDVYSRFEFDYYLSGLDRIVIYPLETDVEKGDIFLINFVGGSKQCACSVHRIAQEQRFNAVYKRIYLKSIYPE